jgi:hypothetical protein
MPRGVISDYGTRVVAEATSRETRRRDWKVPATLSRELPSDAAMRPQRLGTERNFIRLHAALQRGLGRNMGSPRYIWPFSGVWGWPQLKCRGGASAQRAPLCNPVRPGNAPGACEDGTQGAGWCETQRKPRWPVEVSSASPWRAAGRYLRQ